MKPSGAGEVSGFQKWAMFGSTAVIWLFETPNQRSISAKYVRRCAWQQASAVANIIVAIQREIGKGAEDFSAIDRAAHEECIASPRVVGAPAVGSQGAPEIGRGEGDDVIAQAQFLQSALERGEGGIDFEKLIGLRVEQIGVHIPSAPVDEEGLLAAVRDRSGS